MSKTIHRVIHSAPQSLPSCYRSLALEIDEHLQQGKPYQSLKGCRIRCAKDLVRFRLGLYWRLIYQFDGSNFVPMAIVSRQSFEDVIKRR